MTATNIFYTWLMQKQNPAQQSMPGMKAMMYLMPLMFLAILNNYSAGLSYYYFLSTLFGIIMTYVIRASMNEEKILEQMKYNLEHPKKKSEMSGCAGLAARAQEAQKLQQKQM
jgi:YidC/Oxa1 family membrane protein insertase